MDKALQDIVVNQTNSVLTRPVEASAIIDYVNTNITIMFSVPVNPSGIIAIRTENDINVIYDDVALNGSAVWYNNNTMLLIQNLTGVEYSKIIKFELRNFHNKNNELLRPFTVYVNSVKNTNANFVPVFYSNKIYMVFNQAVVYDANSIVYTKRWPSGYNNYNVFNRESSSVISFVTNDLIYTVQPVQFRDAYGYSYFFPETTVSNAPVPSLLANYYGGGTKIELLPTSNQNVNDTNSIAKFRQIDIKASITNAWGVTVVLDNNEIYKNETLCFRPTTLNTKINIPRKDNIFTHTISVIALGIGLNATNSRSIYFDTISNNVYFVPGTNTNKILSYGIPADLIVKNEGKKLNYFNVDIATNGVICYNFATNYGVSNLAAYNKVSGEELQIK